MKKKLTRIVYYVLALSVVSVIVVAFLPSPIKVKLPASRKGRFEYPSTKKERRAPTIALSWQRR